MFVNFKGSIFGLLRWQWRAATFLVVVASAIVALDHHGHVETFRVPALPLAIVGGAIGIFVSFRTNSGYERWWEGRKLWGALVNSSRHFCTQVLTYVGGGAANDEARRRIVRRHIAYVHTLRCLLRKQEPAEDDDVAAALSADELAGLEAESNATHALLQRQQEELVGLSEAGHIDAFRLQRLDDSIRALLDVQGGCERIANTPFPPGYGFLADRLILAMGVLLPLGLVESLGWLAVPLTVLVCLSFRLIGEVGRVLETPFTMFWPALPLSALSKTIEINLRQRLGETDLPPMPVANERGILM